jgi:hypothetical protein
MIASSRVSPRILLYFQAVSTNFREFAHEDPHLFSFPFTGRGPFFRRSYLNRKYFRFPKFTTFQNRQVTSAKTMSSSQFLIQPPLTKLTAFPIPERQGRPAMKNGESQENQA